MENYGLLIGLGYVAAIATFIAYVWNLHLLLRRCAAENRTMRPGLVWLQVVPVFGAIWQFWVVRRLSSSLEREYRSRGWPVASAPGRSLGLAKAIVDAVALIHVIAFFWIVTSLANIGPTLDQVAFTYLFFVAGLLQLASIVLWGAYWATLSKYSSGLRLPPPGTLPIFQPMPTQGPYCWTCGSLTGPVRFCPSCGRQLAPGDSPAPN